MKHFQTHPLAEEQGRTMTEMLGVLVIMGVLSLVGIAGYQWGMNKLKANDLIAELNYYVVDLSSQMIRGGDLDVSSIPDHIRNGNGLTTYQVVGVDFFGFTVSDVTKGVCEQVLNSDWTTPRYIRVNGKQVIFDGIPGADAISVAEACSEEKNEMTFEFYKTPDSCNLNFCEI